MFTSSDENGTKRREVPGLNNSGSNFGIGAAVTMVGTSIIKVTLERTSGDERVQGWCCSAASRVSDPEAIDPDDQQATSRHRANS